MTTTRTRFTRLLSGLDRRPWCWLLLGVLLISASQLRFGIGLLAWIAPLPFLRHARITSGWRARLALSLASFAAWVLALSKIITEPLPPVFAVLFALPVAAMLTLPYLVLPPVRQRLGEGAAILTFGASMVAGEWALHVALPFGTWGSAANTQLEQLALPRHRVPTLYGVLGDWFPLASAAFAALVRRSRWYAARRWPTASSPPRPAPPSRRASGSASSPASS